MLGLWLTACGSRSSLIGGPGFDAGIEGGGGTFSGGASSGGQSSGGGGSGGQNSGGQASGGQSSGGQGSGGQGSGGENLGGMGGDSGCPQGYIDEGSGCQPLLTDLWTFEGTVEPPVSPTTRSHVVTVPIWGLPQFLVARSPEAASVHITPSGGDASLTEEMLDAQPWRAPSLVPGEQRLFDLVVSEEGLASTWYTVATYREGIFHYIKASNTEAGAAFGYAVAVSADGHALAVGASQESSGAVDSGAVYVFTRQDQAWTQEAYLKASNTGDNDSFGSSLDLSADGNVLVVGANQESSSATGVDGDQLDDSATGAGAAYVFSRSGSTWAQDAYVKASNTEQDDQFGVAVAIAADGQTFAVGAANESSSAKGVNGDQSLDDAYLAGAVYVFSRVGGTTVQQAYVKASNTTGEDRFGMHLDLSGDGNTLVVGAPYENSFASGIDGDQTDFGAGAAGAAYSFSRQGSTWAQDAYIKAVENSDGDLFGSSVALSGDGSTLAVGASGHLNDNGLTGVGAAFVLVRSGTSWMHEGMVKSVGGRPEAFGWSIGLSYDGNLLVVGAPHDGSSAPGINGDPFAEPAKAWAGAAYRFERTDAYWEQVAYIKASNPYPLNLFGTTVGMTADGKTIVAGSSGERSSATGVDGDPWNQDAPLSGAVYTYTDE